MADYQYLTAEEQAQIVAEVQASRPTPEQIVHDREAAHYRATIEAKMGWNDPPDPFVPPAAEVAAAEAEHVVLDEEADKLPAPPVKAEEVGVNGIR